VFRRLSVIVFGLCFLFIGLRFGNTAIVDGLLVSQDKGIIRFLWGAQIGSEKRDEIAKMFFELLGTQDRDLWVNLSIDSSELDLLGDGLLNKKVGIILLDADLRLKRAVMDLFSEFPTEGNLCAMPRFWIVLKDVNVIQSKNGIKIVGLNLAVKFNLSGHPRLADLIRKRVIPRLNHIINTSEQFSNLRELFRLSVLRWWVLSNFKDTPSFLGVFLCIIPRLSSTLPVRRRYLLRDKLNEYAWLYQSGVRYMDGRFVVSGGVDLSVDPNIVKTVGEEVGKKSRLNTGETSTYNLSVDKMRESPELEFRLMGEVFGRYPERLAALMFPGIVELLLLGGEDVKDIMFQGTKSSPFLDWLVLGNKEVEDVTMDVQRIILKIERAVGKYYGVDIDYGWVWEDNRLVPLDESMPVPNEVEVMIEHLLNNGNVAQGNWQVSNDLSSDGLWVLKNRGNKEEYIIAVKSGDVISVRHARIGSQNGEIGQEFIEVLRFVEILGMIEMGKIKEMATDSLTGLFVRGHLEKLFSMEFNREVRKKDNVGISAILLDIDHFKKVNDTYGHDVGDLVLQRVSELLRETVRESDIVGRWGGEEFVAILPGTDLSKAQRVAERIRKRIEQETIRLKDGTELKVTVSLGVSFFSPAQLLSAGKDSALESLVKMADEALYRAKETGRNKVVVANLDREKDIYLPDLHLSVDPSAIKFGEELFNIIVERLNSGETPLSIAKDILGDRIKGRGKICHYLSKLDSIKTDVTTKAILFSFILSRFNVLEGASEREMDSILGLRRYVSEFVYNELVSKKQRELSFDEIQTIRSFADDLWEESKHNVVTTSGEKDVGGILLSCFKSL